MYKQKRTIRVKTKNGRILTIRSWVEFVNGQWVAGAFGWVVFEQMTKDGIIFMSSVRKLL